MIKTDRIHPNNWLAMLVIFVAITGTGTSNADQAGNITIAALTSWLEAYGDAWESRDPDKAAVLFSSNSSYQVTPYEKAHIGQNGVRRYWAGVTENQRNVQFQSQALSVTGNSGIAHWSAKFDVEPDGTRIELDGIFVLEFDQNGKCRRLREWWHLRSEGAEAGSQK